MKPWYDRFSKQRSLQWIASLGLAGALALPAASATAQQAQTTPTASTTPAVVKNIVLVHGAFVDASGWKPVYEILISHGFSVTMVQPPLTALQDDVAATNRILDLQTGPLILVAHSYGGSVITEAGVDPNVVGLVYVAASAPDVGEDEGALEGATPSATMQQPGALQTTADGFMFLNPADFFQDFAADLTRDQADFESRSQVLAAVQIFNTPLSAAAWRTKPSWGIVAGADRIINPDLERFYYARAHSHTTELEGASHSVYESRPNEVAAVIEDAAQHAAP